MPTIDELKAMVQRKAQEKGIGNLWPIIDQIIQRESGWNPAVPSGYNTPGGEDSWGLFQDNRNGGLGTGHSVAELTNPEWSAEYNLNIIAQRAKQGLPLEQIFSDWTTAPGVIGVAAAQGGGNMVTQQQQEPATTPKDITQDVIKWLKTIYPDTTNAQGEVFDMAAWQFGQNPTGWIDYYRKSVLGEAEGATPTWAQQQSAAQGWAGLGQNQEQLALSQKQFEFSMQQALDQAQRDQQQFGLAIAAQNFANTINQAQEARARAQFAIDYSRAQAPAGMTESPYTGKDSAYAQYMTEHGYTPRKPLPMVQANLPADPWALLGQAGTTMPAGPQFEAAPPMPSAAPPTPTAAPTMDYTAPATMPTPVPTPVPTPSPTETMTTQGPLMTPIPTVQPWITGVPGEMLPVGPATQTSMDSLIEAMRRMGLWGG